MNGWPLYRSHCEQLNVPEAEQRSFLEFSTEVALALINPGKATPNKSRGRPPKRSSEESIPHGRKRAVIPFPFADIRFDNVGQLSQSSGLQSLLSIFTNYM